MNAAAVIGNTIRRALERAPLIWRKNGWYYRDRKFAPGVVRAAINKGDAIQIGNFVIRKIEDIGQPNMSPPHHSFDHLTDAGKSLLRRAVIAGELTIEKFIGSDGNVAPYELVIAGFALIRGFTIMPNEFAVKTNMSHSWRDLTEKQRGILIELHRTRASLSAKAYRDDTLASLIRNELLSPDDLTITDFGVAVVDRYNTKEST